MGDKAKTTEDKMLHTLELSSYIKPERVISLHTADKQQVIDRLIELLALDPVVHDKELMKQAIWLREKQLSTGIGEGIAIPHARTKAVSDFAVALARIETGVEYNALDAKPVHLVFMIVASDTQDKTYIKLLSRLMLRMKNTELVQQLILAKDAEELFRILVETR